MRKNSNSYIGSSICVKLNKYFVFGIVCTVFVISAIIWLFIVYRYNGGLPLFNGGRSFYYDTGAVSFIYQGICGVINILTAYFGLYWINNKKGLLGFVFGAFLSISTGSHSSFFISIIYPIVLVLFYKRFRRFNLKMMIKLSALLIALLFFGLFISPFRSGKMTEPFSFINSLVYSNSFCDIRDGAYLFWGYDHFLNNEIIFGKTYLAGLLSFIPSSLSPFRLEWSWGRFSTVKLFNGAWPNHFGFRGGIAFEMYANFRMPGVIILSILSGYIFANVEKCCNINIYNKLLNEEKYDSSIIVYTSLLSALKSFLICSSGMANFYVFIVLFVVIWFIRNILPVKSRRMSHD